ncbi:hypothetical protein Ndes2437B_g08451 [Nannochloris sp. 'desiccata']|nr:hypothetical protein KSW81_000510 [Chlorella desiccata (nom. nud.)]
MAAGDTVPGVYVVKVTDVPCSLIDSFEVVLEKAAKFYSSFSRQRSFLARRDDLELSDMTWAVICFRNQQDAVKCAQWLSSEPLLSGDGPSTSFEGRVQVLNRLQAPSKDLEKATIEAKKHAKTVVIWEQANRSLLTHPQSPTLQLGTSVVHFARTNATTPQATTAIGVSSKKVDPLPYPSAVKREKPLASATNKAVITTETKKDFVAPSIDERKISKSKQMIAEGLSKAMDASTTQSSKVMRSELANSIVNAILALNIDTHEFSEKIRHIQFNLGKNAELRISVLEGTIPPDALVKMRSEDMETREQAEKRRKIQEKSLETHVLPHGDIVFGRNIDAALQLKREAQGYKEPRYSDADTLNNSSRLNNASSKSALLPVVDAVVNDVHPIAQKRLRLEIKDSSSSDSDSDRHNKHDVEDCVINDKRAKKSVKFDTAQIGPAKKAEEKRVAPPNPETCVNRHHSSFLDKHVQTPSHLPRQQIDWGPPIEHVDLAGGWSPPSILGNQGKIYKGQLAWTNVTGNFQADVEVVGFQPAAFIRLPKSLDVVESISLNEMLYKIRESGAKPWNLHRAWIVGPKLPGLFGRVYLESLIPETLESPTIPLIENDDDGSGHSIERLIETLDKHKGIVTSPKRPKLNTRNTVRGKAYDENSNNEGIQKRKTVGRILVNLDGEILHNYNEGWTKDSHVGWEMFIMEPTIAACEAASALLQEGDSARKSHALLMIAIPHYWGELLPLGQNGIRQSIAGSGRIYISASGASTLHRLPKVVNCNLKAHRSRLNLSDVWDSVFGEQNVRLYPRQPTNAPPNLLLNDQEQEENEENRENVAAFDALEKRLQDATPYGADALICQHGVPNHLDLAVAAPAAHSNHRKYLLLGCWNRKIVPGVGHYAVNFRDPRSWM